MNFNIHNIFKFKIEGTDRRCLKHFSQDYSYFRTDEEIESELDIIVSDFIPSNNDCYIVNHKYYAKENYLFCNDSHKIVRWCFCIRGIEGKPTVYFKGGLFSDIFLRDYIIEPLIGFKLAQKGYSLLHASSIVIDGKGFVFAGTPGVGKSAIILNLSRNDTAFLSDEITLLSNNSLIYSFPSPIRVYNYNLRSNLRLYKKMTLKDKFETRLKYFIYILSLKYAKLFQDIGAENLFDKIEKKSPLHSLVLLSKTTKNEINLVQGIDKKEFVKRLILVNKYQFRHFSEYMSAYSYCYPKSEMTSYWQVLENNLFDSIKKVHCYEIEVPSEYNYGSFEEFDNILNEIWGL
jgi:hypothetical protein